MGGMFGSRQVHLKVRRHAIEKAMVGRFVERVSDDVEQLLLLSGIVLTDQRVIVMQAEQNERLAARLFIVGEQLSFFHIDSKEQTSLLSIDEFGVKEALENLVCCIQVTGQMGGGISS